VDNFTKVQNMQVKNTKTNNVGMTLKSLSRPLKTVTTDTY